MNWHAAGIDAIVTQLQTDPLRGLDPAEAQERLARHGPNELAKGHRASPARLFFGQFKNTLIVILLVATVLSALLGEIADAAIILVIVLFCAILGFVQEYRAERALDALTRMLAPTIAVLRGGVEQRIPSRELVAGDIMLLEAGDRIPADARLVELHSLKCDEAPLTGESFSVEKGLQLLAVDTAVSDRHNLVFTGTTVTYGRGKAIVTGTAMSTEFGKIAEQVSTVSTEKSPLEKRTAEIGRWLGLIALGVCGIAIAVSIARAWMGDQLNVELLLTVTMFAIALAVAAVPEALAAIVTGALAVGMHEMAKRNALVRRMPAVETLGCTTVICTDKTGTLTKGEMTARRVFVGGRTSEVSGAGYAPTGEFNPPLPLDDNAVRLMLTGGVLCSDAGLSNDAGRWFVKGDSTEGALVVLAAKAGLRQEETRLAAPRIAELPFSSERKRMTTVHRLPDGRHLAFVKGAPEVLLERCASAQHRDRQQTLTDAMRTQILAVNEDMAKDALRVLAIAYKEVCADEPIGDEETVERGLTLLGLIGMMDPPRDEAKEAVRVCRQVHIRPIMITGDHKLTAVAVAAEIDIYREGDLVLTGDDLSRMGDEQFAQIVDRVSVYARVSPMDKLKIVRAWKNRGEIVAMTGDGVNDAPALKHADIGIAMGISGTDVAKEAADMVLADDNFATIVRAIERGRWIYDNIKKYLTYLLRANITEVVVLGGVVIVVGPELLPLLPAAILYINLATDGLPALALGLSPPDRDIMQRPPRDPKESIFSHDVRLLVLLGVMVECPIFLWIYFDNYADIELARTKVFLLFVFVELFIAMSFRSLRYSIFEAPPHKWLLLAMAWELGLFGVLIQFQIVRETFGISMPTWPNLAMALGVSALVVFAIELTKAYLRMTTAGAEKRSSLMETGLPKLDLRKTTSAATEAALAPMFGRPVAGIAQQGNNLASIAKQFAGGNAMRRILIPVDSSPNCQFAVKHVIKEFLKNTPLEIHLLNVQAPFLGHIARFARQGSRHDYHRDQAAKALGPIKQMLDGFSIPYSAHIKTGERARTIADAAHRLHCDLIVLSSARENSLTRIIENSVTNKVLELTTVPVEVITGDSVHWVERYGIPAGLGAALALLIAGAVE